MKSLLGKISYCEFGFGGHSDKLLGLKLKFKPLIGDDWEISHFIPAGWCEAYSPDSPKSVWKESDRTKLRVDICKSVDKMLSDAGVLNLSDLIDAPVELRVKNDKLFEFRVIAEINTGC